MAGTGEAGTPPLPLEAEPLDFLVMLERLADEAAG